MDWYNIRFYNFRNIVVNPILDTCETTIYKICQKNLNKNVIPFATSYLLEKGFFILAVIKVKHQPKINIEKEMRIAISKLETRFEHFMKYIYETKTSSFISLNIDLLIWIC